MKNKAREINTFECFIAACAYLTFTGLRGQVLSNPCVSFIYFHARFSSGDGRGAAALEGLQITNGF